MFCISLLAFILYIELSIGQIYKCSILNYFFIMFVDSLIQKVVELYYFRQHKLGSVSQSEFLWS
uniref:Uncharacterized protein n=1 Tax=Octopus bimaculoides TaxID=37653 RepID=A0A0L8GQY3_OCTBM